MLIGLVTVQLTGFTLIDPIVALIVVLLILKVGCDILKKSFGALLDIVLRNDQLIVNFCSKHFDGALRDRIVEAARKAAKAVPAHRRIAHKPPEDREIEAGMAP